MLPRRPPRYVLSNPGLVDLKARVTINLEDDRENGVRDKGYVLEPQALHTAAYYT
jgi:hypothetical protein